MNYTEAVEKARQGRGYVIFDGAIGTALATELPYSRGVKTSLFPDVVTSFYPKTLYRLHADYLRNGADVITTNTILASQPFLDHFGLKLDPEQMVKDAVGIAETAIKEVGGKKRFIAGSIGPMAGILDMDFEEAVELMKEKVGWFLEAGVDLIMLETQLTLAEIKAYLTAIEEAMNDFEGPGTPIHVSLAPQDDLKTPREDSLANICEYLSTRDGIVAYGLNCVPPPIVKTVSALHLSSTTDKGLSLLPSAGPTPEGFLPPRVLSGLIDEALKASRVRIIGGCCGTTPSHIRSLSLTYPSVSDN